MKIFIVSDTHQSHRSLEKALEQEGAIDMLIHLGDVEGGEDYISALVDCPIHIIGGNNDFFSDLPREKDFFIEGRHIFITHGHPYLTGLNENGIWKEALRRGADIVMYGHTHRPSLSEKEGVTILKPGSISWPRQPGRRKSYMMMETDGQGNIRFELKYI